MCINSHKEQYIADTIYLASQCQRFSSQARARLASVLQTASDLRNEPSITRKPRHPQASLGAD